MMNHYHGQQLSKAEAQTMDQYQELGLGLMVLRNGSTKGPSGQDESGQSDVLKRWNNFENIHRNI